MHRDSETLLAQLMTTPVGRRWILKAGLGSAAAIAAAAMSRSDAATAWAADLHQAATPANQSTSASSANQPKPTANRTLQFALTPAVSGEITNLELVANGARTSLVAHTADTRTALRNQGGMFAAADLSKLTHYVPDAQLPADRAMLISVHGRRGNNEVLVAQTMHVPAATTLAMAQLASTSVKGLRSMAGSDARLQSLGLNAAQVTTPQDIEQLDSVVNLHNTAVTWAGLHPQVATIDPTGATATKTLLQQTPEVVNLGNQMIAMQSQGQDIATLVTVKNPDGSDTQLQFTDTKTNPPTVTTRTFTTIQLNPDGDQTLQSATKSALVAGVVAVRNTDSLGSVVDKPLSDYPIGTRFNTWHQSQGVTPQAKPYTPAPSSPAALGGSGASIDVGVKNGGDLFGTKTVVTGGYSNGQVPIRIYNNWVRWVHAYVQYLGAGGTNLSANPNATSPDTKYSQSLDLIPQVFTLLGAPLWNTNTVDVMLNFPQDAVTARVLYCGLGSDINGGGWRQYFPDGAYPNLIAPQDEVLVPALITGLVTIGLNVFALATDTAIAGLWGSIRPIVANPGSRVAIEDILQAITKLSAAEAAAMAVASGGATYADISGQGGSTTNIWETLLALATVIPKILFSPQILFGTGAGELIAELAATIFANLGADKAAEAVPLVGQVMAIVAAVGDAATLAEVATETIIAPWVIENEISLSYPATITINRDPRAATFPVTATNWSLQAKIDGSLMPDIVAGSINPDGRIESDPVIVNVSAPFGGENIQWTVVFTDADGHQVGTGVSAQYPNDDPSKAQTEVEFAIIELPATIDANTVFLRGDTVIYSDSAGGFTWSSDVTDNGTVANSGMQVVTNATVATTLGVVGVVWKQNDQYFIQGMPVAENGATITLQPPSKPYARPPFLLFDAMVGKTDVGNHVLLEPDATSDGYFLRLVNLDSDTGAITWDSTRALGKYTLPVSAAALHSSGRVVTIHTDSGRVGIVQPAAADSALAGVASYSSGPGTQIGLLQSPIAVAVTNPGVVLILEAGAQQLSAFDLNGNPIKYFGSDSSQYRTALAASGTYLDLAVDGASHIYLLYYTGDGSQPGDYRVDVYNPDGTPLATNSPGTNVAKLAVDFWRSIFGVNFTAISAPGSSVSVPSISRFDPSEGGTS
jgi:hypothetical protein